MIRSVLVSIVQREKGDSGDSVLTLDVICSPMLVLIPLLLLLLLFITLCRVFIII